MQNKRARESTYKRPNVIGYDTGNNFITTALFQDIFLFVIILCTSSSSFDAGSGVICSSGFSVTVM